jgi:D-alanyl-D-alanine carboxypeptidase
MSDNLTSTGADGAIIVSTKDIIKWVRTLFIDHAILDEQQKIKLMTMVSTNTGKPIHDISKTDPTGFGLGVFKDYNADYPKESMWTYEGCMFGFRAIYFYIPCNGVISSAAFNSATDDKDDHAKELLNKAYDLIIKNYPSLQ